MQWRTKMRISSKGRYAIAAMITMALEQNGTDPITILSISEKLGISKIYLEQVFSLLKRAELVNSVKGAQGGYKLADRPEKISVGEILHAVEQGLFEKTEVSITGDGAAVEEVMETLVWNPLDQSVSELLAQIPLSQLSEEVKKRQQGSAHMYYI